MTNIAVLVSGGGTNLQALLDAEKADTLQHGRITLVISDNESAYALTRAGRHGVKSEVILRKNYAGNREHSGAVLEKLRANGIGLAVLAGCLGIVSEPLLSEFAGRIVNVHPALLPKFGGRGFYGIRVHEAVLAAGENETGATVHHVTGKIDGGGIILQKKVAVRPGDTPKILQRRVMEEAEWVILPQAAEALCKSLA
jgi:phosphoribosylglycinamide formyltransferase-1